MKISSVGLPVISSYEMALDVYKTSQPFRSGACKGKRPLGRNRRYVQCLIDKIEGTEAIALQLYDADLVVWYPNGEAHVSMCKWDTVSTRQFIHAVTPFAVANQQGATHLQVKGNWYWFEHSESVLIIKDGEVVNPVQEHVYTVSRKAFAEVRNRFAHFREYVASMGSVLYAIQSSEIDSVQSRWLTENGQGADRLPLWSLPTPSNFYFHGRQAPQQRIDLALSIIRQAQVDNDLDKFYQCFVVLGASALRYHSPVGGYTVTGWRDCPIAIGNTLLSYFDEMLKHTYKEQIFKRTAVPLGKKISCTNRKYF